MNLSTDKRNIYAYRILTLGNLRVMTTREYGKQVHNIAIGDNLNGSKYDKDVDEVIAVNDTLEDVEYRMYKVHSLGGQDKILELTVQVTDDETEQSQIITCEYLLTPEENATCQSLYNIKVIEEED